MNSQTKSSTDSLSFQIHSLHSSVEKSPGGCLSNMSTYCVRWTPSIDGYFEFIKDYRSIIGCALGGSRVNRYQYNDPTIAKVLSIGMDDNRSCFPQRISLSNFKIGCPITSYGVIYRYRPDPKVSEGYRPDPKGESEYLLVKRNDSVNYIDIIRGNYRESQLYLMIQDLPENERQGLLEYDFDTLWNDLHLKPAEGNAYEYGKEVFKKLSPHFKELFKRIPSQDPDGKYLWLFPKGRPNYQNDRSFLQNDSDQLKLVPESPFECAIREFKEETNGFSIDKQEESLLFSEPVVESYLGSNSKNYQTNYFVFETNVRNEITPFNTSTTPIRIVSVGEVGEIKWVPYSQLKLYLRTSRQELINFIEQNYPSNRPIKLSDIWKKPIEINDFMLDPI